MNEFVIIDTSVWIDFFNGKLTTNTKYVFELLDNKYIIIPPIILQEVLQGITTNEMFNIVEDLFLGLNFISFDSYEIAFKSAELYRTLRKKGVTIRSSNDAVIATLAIMYEAKLLHNDKDFDNIAKYTSLKIYK
jgi:predicted nucleic acid-binding protein